MTPYLEISFIDPAAELDSDSSADLICGLTATLRIACGSRVWCDQHFPILELAIHLSRHSDARQPFTSMCMEEDPVLIVRECDDGLELRTYDGMRLRTSDAEVKTAARRFVALVDELLSARFGRSIDQVERSLR